MPSDVFDHARFELPGDDAPLWRYTSVNSVVSLLEGRHLFFPSIATLAEDGPLREGDPREGWHTDREAAELERYRDRPDALAETPGTAAYLRSERKRWAASCWHYAASESWAMWELYSQRGVAIVSSLRQLSEAIDRNITPGFVNYVNFGADGDPQEADTTANVPRAILDSELRFMRKDQSYSHEREVRLLIKGEDDETFDGGCRVPCNPESLISEIVIHPRLTWEAAAIRRLLGRYELGPRVRDSSLRPPGRQLTDRNTLRDD